MNIKNSMRFFVIIENLLKRIKEIQRKYLKEIQRKYLKDIKKRRKKTEQISNKLCVLFGNQQII